MPLIDHPQLRKCHPRRKKPLFISLFRTKSSMNRNAIEFPKLPAEDDVRTLPCAVVPHDSIVPAVGHVPHAVPFV